MRQFHVSPQVLKEFSKRVKWEVDSTKVAKAGSEGGRREKSAGRGLQGEGARELWLSPPPQSGSKSGMKTERMIMKSAHDPDFE